MTRIKLKTVFSTVAALAVASCSDCGRGCSCSPSSSTTTTAALDSEPAPSTPGAPVASPVRPKPTPRNTLADGVEPTEDAPPVTPVSPERRAELLTELGHAMLEGGDIDRLHELCDQGLGDACSREAKAYSEGSRGVDRDAEHAKELYLKACDLGDYSGCTVVGTQTFDRGLLDKACEHGQGPACAAIGDYYTGKWESSPGTADYGEAIRYYENGCLGIAGKDACASLGMLYKEGKGVPQDPQKARQYLEIACKSGVRWACSEMR